MYKLVRENLSHLGGPMGSEYTTTDWVKYFESPEMAKVFAQENASASFSGSEITWKKTSEYKNNWSSQDLTSHKYYLIEIEPESDKPKNAIPYTDVLEKIHDNMRQIDQWAEMSSFENSSKYTARATALIELLEVSNCGSIGGYDRGQESFRDYPDNPFRYVHRNMWYRFCWLKKKVKS